MPQMAWRYPEPADYAAGAVAAIVSFDHCRDCRGNECRRVCIMEQPGESRLETFLLDSAERGRRGWHWLPRVLLVLAGALLVLGWYWSREPAAINPSSSVAAAPPSGQALAAEAGVVSTATLLAIARTLLDKPGGYISNDALPPGVLLDNMPAFEAGILAHVRDMLRVMRRDFSLSPSQSIEDPDLVRAESRFMFDSTSWLLPSTESEYRDGIAALDRYAARLAEPEGAGAHFYARSDNLARWFEDVDARLAAYGQRLASAAAPGAAAHIAWSEIDKGFYEARGYCWALRAQLQATQVDFAPVLVAHPAENSVANAVGNNTAEQNFLAQAIIALDGTQQPVNSPVILNGSEYGLLANHSLVMASYIARARAVLMQLRGQLAAQ